MTEQQKKYVFQIADEIQQDKNGKNIKVFTSATIVRIQDTKNNANYRLVVICKDDTKKTIRTKMFSLFTEMTKGRKHESRKKKQN